MAALQTLLSPQVLTKVISRQALPSDWLSNLFGVQMGGKNIMNYGHGRTGAYHIYDHLRKVGQGRAPGTAAHRRSPNNVGRVDFTYPRMHDSIGLLAEFLHNLGQIANPAERDEMGQDMIKRQTRSLAELCGNWRKAQLIGAIRDSLYVGFEGDNMYFDFDSPAGSGLALPTLKVEARMPESNKGQLNMLGDGDILDVLWSDETADIPGHIGRINAAFQQLNGGHLSTIICGTRVWNEVIKNERVAAIHGSAHSPFVTLSRDSLDPMIASTMKNTYRAVLSVYPDVTWYITDEGLEVGSPGNEVFKKIVPDDQALFIGHTPDDGTVGCYEGAEPIAERDGDAPKLKRGMQAWSVSRANPTSTDLFVLDNAFVCNHVPDSHAVGTVL